MLKIDSIKEMEFKEAIEHHRFYVSELMWKPATIFITASFTIFTLSISKFGEFSSAGCFVALILYLFWYLHCQKVNHLIKINRKYLVKMENKFSREDNGRRHQADDWMWVIYRTKEREKLRNGLKFPQITHMSTIKLINWLTICL